MFGSELLVAPITSPADRATGLGRVRAWLPEGTWTDVFTGVRPTPAAAPSHLHRDLTSIPVLARAGAIVPLVPADALEEGTDLPSVVEVRVYAGADGTFTLAEDNDDERWALHPHDVRRRRPASSPCTPVEGDAATLPADRTYRVRWCSPPTVPSTQQRVFALLDRAQIGFELKASVHDAVRSAPGAGAAVLDLQALDLSPTLLGALSEILLAR